MARLQHPQQRQPVVVELPSNVFDDLNGGFWKGSPSLGLEVGKRGEKWAQGKRDWLRYPLSDAAVHSVGVVEGEPAEAGGRGDQGRFYYIKRALQSELTWDLLEDTGRYYENPRYGCGFVM